MKASSSIYAWLLPNHHFLDHTFSIHSDTPTVNTTKAIARTNRIIPSSSPTRTPQNILFSNHHDIEFTFLTLSNDQHHNSYFQNQPFHTLFLTNTHPQKQSLQQRQNNGALHSHLGLHLRGGGPQSKQIHRAGRRQRLDSNIES